MKNQVLYFTSPGCSVCNVLKPKVKTLVEERYPNLEWREINIVEERDVAAQYNVFTVPVLIVELEGKEYVRLIRAFSLGEVQEKTDRIYSLLFED